MELADAVLEILSAPSQWPAHPEMSAVAPLLEIQARWSGCRLPETLLVEGLRSREGSHVFVYPFCGRLANEGMATLVAARWARRTPQTFSINANDYGFELLSPRRDLPRLRTRFAKALSAENLAEDLLTSVNLAEITRTSVPRYRAHRGPGVPGLPGSGKSTRQIQASSGLVYDVLRRYDPTICLVEQARLEVLEAQLEFSRISGRASRGRAAEYQRDKAGSLDAARIPRSGPAGCRRRWSPPSHWQTRIERAARELEAQAIRGRWPDERWHIVHGGGTVALNACCGETLLLHPERANHLAGRRRTLLIADPHFGKDDVFRRAGIALPDRHSHADWRGFHPA